MSVNDLNALPRFPRKLRPGYRAKLAYTGGSRMNRSNQTLTGTIQTTNQGHINFLQALRGCAFDIVSCDGYGGRHISLVNANFDTQVLAYDPDIVIIGADAVGNYINVDPVTAPGKAEISLAFMVDMVDKCIARGIVPVVSTMPPNLGLFATLAVDPTFGDAAGGDDAGGTMSKETLKFNQLMLDYARNNDHVLLHRWGRQECYVDRADGRYVQSYTAGTASTTRTFDGVHQNPRLAIEMAIDLDKVLGTLFEDSTFPFPEATIDPNKWVLNPLTVGTAGTASGSATGSVATSCTLNAGTLTAGTCVGAKVARDDLGANGTWQRITATGCDKSITFTFSGASSLPVDFVAGTDAIFGAIEVYFLATPTNFRGCKITVSYADGGAKTFIGLNTAAGVACGDAGAYYPINRLLTLPTAIVKPTSAMTSITSIAVEFTKSAAGNQTFDCYVGRAGCAINPHGVPFVEIAPTTP